VDADSGESGNRTRDNLMKKNQLETARYPQVIFHPERFTGSLTPGSAANLTVGGMFNIHGSDHPLTLNFKIQIDGNKVTATTHFVVPYVAWGMKDPSTLMLRVAKEVHVDVTARGWMEEGK
jgi:polyisoprenoid-binding protein YceI